MPTVYANEFDRHAAHWLSCIPIRFDLIDERSIKEVTGDDVIRFTQCHFFAGIGGWPLALEMAGWPDDVEVWTGSCPCQPFSAAGKRKGTADERHLWPEFRRLIAERRPATIFGEQVASAAGRDWLSAVRLDLEALGYAVGAADLCAASVGAPHIRQRLFWVAHCDSYRRYQGRDSFATPRNDGLIRNGSSSRLANGSSSGLEERQEQPTRQELATVERSGDVGRMANAPSTSGPQHERKQRRRNATTQDVAIHRCDSVGVGNAKSIRREQGRAQSDRRYVAATGPQWDSVEYIPCSDGKARPVKPGVCLLAHGIPGRVAQLRGLGNAIVPQVAAEFVAAFMELKGFT